MIKNQKSITDGGSETDWDISLEGDGEEQQRSAEENLVCMLSLSTH